MTSSCIIVYYKNEENLKICLNSCLAQTTPFAEIIVVNNSQSQKIILEKDLSSVKLINIGKNIFFSEALNIGIRASSGEVVLCLNDDVCLKEDFLKIALQGFLKDKSIGMVSGKVLFFNRETINSTGLFLSRSRKPIDRGYHQIDKGQFNQEGFVFGVPGAVGLYSRKMLEDISLGGDYFDSGYKMFYEDLDICWRAHNQGYKAYYLPGAVAYHARGASVKTNKPRSTFLAKFDFAWLTQDLQLMLLENRYKTIIKNDKWVSFLWRVVFIAGYDIKILLYVLMLRPTLLVRFFKDLSWVRDAFLKRKAIKGGKRTLYSR